ncbi:MAG: protein arginine kinase [Phycisphaerae bacterium]|nr:protein arginine kinase [Phycisphaerae bacterium]
MNGSRTGDAGDLRSGGPWLDAGSPDGDVVISSRVRLARNLSGFPFPRRATAPQAREVIEAVRRAAWPDDLASGLIWVGMNDASAHERDLLVERHLISRQFAQNEAPRSVAVSADESLSVMVNEEDHLRMQVLLPGFRLVEAYQRVRRLDEQLEESLDIAAHPRWGYLTACPTNVGCGIRLSVMLHLPGLRITNEIERVRRAAKDLHLAVRGFYGEGSESAGDFYQVSNQVTLGISEDDLLAEFAERVVPEVVAYERESRRLLAERNATLLDDRVFRSLGVLRSARMLGLEESMKLLSRLRMGLCLRRLDAVPMETINRLFLMVQPAHLRTVAGLDLNDDQLREARATMVRKILGGD